MATTPQAPTNSQQAQEIPPIVYGVFYSGIDQQSIQKLSNNLLIANNGNVKEVHLAFQSAGGFIGDGVCLYNLLKSLPIKTIFYNMGQVSSAALTAYLGASHRVVNAQASFMIHRSTMNPQPSTSRNLKHVAQALALDDARTEAILREHITMPDELWTQMQYHDLHLSAEEAVKFGIAHEVGDFGPPVGSNIFNALG